MPIDGYETNVNETTKSVVTPLIVPLPKSPSKKNTSNKIGKIEPNMMAGKGHKSRRDIQYDEQDSGDSSGEDDSYDWVTDSMQYLNTDGFESKVKPNERFKNYKDVFNNLVVS